MRRRSILKASAGLALWPAVSSSYAVSAAPQRIGVNCFDLFYGNLVDPKRVRKPGERIRELADAGIPFIRFAASPFWPNEWRIYKQQRSRYLDLLAEVNREAASAGMGLVPSIFWNPASVSDFVGEPTSAWIRAESKTQDFAKDYVADVLKAMGGSSSVLFWEFGNEFNLNLDLPDARRWWPKVNQEMGTPARRTEADVITTVGYQALQESFCHWIKSDMPGARVSTGADRPHPHAFNLSVGKSSPDTREQFRRAVQMANPACAEVASLHLYPDKVGAYFNKTSDVRSVLQEAREATRQTSQLLFLGEFGVADKGPENIQRQIFSEFLEAIQSAQVDLAALWVYDFHYQPEISVTLRNERAWQLHEVLRWNEAAMRRRSK